MDRPASGDIRIGISGWRYPPWRGRFYPKGLAQRRELEFASRSLPTIEVNGTFYSLQTPTSFATWRDETPEDVGDVVAVLARPDTRRLRLRGQGAALRHSHAQAAPRAGAARELLRVGPARARQQTGTDPVAAALYGDSLEPWRAWATDLRGRCLDCGHHMAEEAPDALEVVLRQLLGLQT